MPSFSPVEIPKDIECCICLDMWKDPVELQPCRHIFCKECVARLHKCPECRASVQGRGKPHRILLNMMDEITVKCDDCGWTGKKDVSGGHSCEEYRKAQQVAQQASAAASSSSALPPLERRTPPPVHTPAPSGVLLRDRPPEASGSYSSFPDMSNAEDDDAESVAARFIAEAHRSPAPPFPRSTASRLVQMFRSTSGTSGMVGGTVDRSAMNRFIKSSLAGFSRFAQRGLDVLQTPDVVKMLSKSGFEFLSEATIGYLVSRIGNATLGVEAHAHVYLTHAGYIELSVMLSRAHNTFAHYAAHTGGQQHRSAPKVTRQVSLAFPHFLLAMLASTVYYLGTARTVIPTLGAANGGDDLNDAADCNAAELCRFMQQDHRTPDFAYSTAVMFCQINRQMPPRDRMGSIGEFVRTFQMTTSGKPYLNAGDVKTMLEKGRFAVTQSDAEHIVKRLDRRQLGGLLLDDYVHLSCIVGVAVQEFARLGGNPQTPNPIVLNEEQFITAAAVVNFQ